MAVKINGLVAVVGSVFLSRLCGGEDKSISIWKRQVFLSRLCGGEAFLDEMRMFPNFLSRLCGGEVS